MRNSSPGIIVFNVNRYLMMVASRSGPTEMILMGTSRNFSMNAMYSRNS